MTRNSWLSFAELQLQLPFVLPSLLVVDGLPPGLGLRLSSHHFTVLGESIGLLIPRTALEATDANTGTSLQGDVFNLY